MDVCQTCYDPRHQPVMRVAHEDDPWCQDCIKLFNYLMGQFKPIIVLGPYKGPTRAARPTKTRNIRRQRAAG